MESGACNSIATKRRQLGYEPKNVVKGKPFAVTVTHESYGNNIELVWQSSVITNENDKRIIVIQKSKTSPVICQEAQPTTSNALGYKAWVIEYMTENVTRYTRLTYLDTSSSVKSKAQPRNKKTIRTTLVKDSQSLHSRIEQSISLLNTQVYNGMDYTYGMRETLLDNSTKKQVRFNENANKVHTIDERPPMQRFYLTLDRKPLVDRAVPPCRDTIIVPSGDLHLDDFDDYYSDDELRSASYVANMEKEDEEHCLLTMQNLLCECINQDITGVVFVHNKKIYQLIEGTSHAMENVMPQIKSTFKILHQSVDEVDTSAQQVEASCSNTNTVSANTKRVSRRYDTLKCYQLSNTSPVSELAQYIDLNKFMSCSAAADIQQVHNSYYPYTSFTCA